MTECFKCNKCGKYFENEDRTDFKIISGMFGHLISYNLCKKCTDLFKKWLK